MAFAEESDVVWARFVQSRVLTSDPRHCPLHKHTDIKSAKGLLRQDLVRNQGSFIVFGIIMDFQIDQFIEFANWEGSREEAQTYIEAANGSLDLALSFILEGVDPRQHMRSGPVTDSSLNGTSPSSSHIVSSKPRNLSLREEMNEEYTRDLARKVAPLVASEKKIFYLHFPLALPLYKILDLVIDQLQSIIPASLFSWVSTTPHNLHSNKVICQEFEKLHSGCDTNTKLLVSKNYKNALETVKASCEYLLVLVTSELHQVPSQFFVSRVLSMAFTKRDDVKIWGTSAQTVEGMNLVSTFGVEELPFFALLSPSPKTAQSSVIVIENILQVSGASLCTQKSREMINASALKTMEQHEPKLLALKLERSRFDADRQIREEQDLAYYTSLELDRKKAEAAEAKRVENQLWEKAFVLWATQLSERVSRVRSFEGTTSGARVCLRFPDGHRLNIKVPGDQPVSVLYEVAYSDLHPDLTESLNADTTEPQGSSSRMHTLLENFDPPYGFFLISTLTRNILPPSRDRVQDVSCVWPSGVFMVDLD